MTPRDLLVLRMLRVACAIADGGWVTAREVGPWTAPTLRRLCRQKLAFRRRTKRGYRYLMNLAGLRALEMADTMPCPASEGNP